MNSSIRVSKLQIPENVEKRPHLSTVPQDRRRRQSRRRLAAGFCHCEERLRHLRWRCDEAISGIVMAASWMPTRVSHSIERLRVKAAPSRRRPARAAALFAMTFQIDSACPRACTQTLAGPIARTSASTFRAHCKQRSLVCVHALASSLTHVELAYIIQSCSTSSF